jgi:hypothetical protein
LVEFLPPPTTDPPLDPWEIKLLAEGFDLYIRELGPPMDPDDWSDWEELP